MNTANLKIDLITKISQLQNSEVIKDIKRLIDFELNEGIFKTTSAHKGRISEAKIEIKQRKVLSEAKANKEISEWLEK